jgi:8-oxo-dGTP pyrophosphatase MutT (NUDIX family)
MDNRILTDKQEFLNLVIERLGRSPVDFCERADFVAAENARQAGTWGVAGVLVPLFFRENGGGSGEFAFKLIKRSSSVVQAGDLSCPGGMLHPVADEILRPLLSGGLLPVLRGRPRRYLKDRGPSDYRQATLFLANALRESWEEIGLSPFNVEFLGPLPCNPLLAFTRIIFPLVGFIKHDFPVRPNREVEKVVDIPLREFCNRNNYCTYTIEAEMPLRNNVAAIREFPCFTVADAGGEEILWGATFFIITNFLRTVLGFEMPDSPNGRNFKKVLKAEYIMGTRKE